MLMTVRKLFASIILTSVFPSICWAQYDLDLEALLADATTRPSPLSRPFVCGPEEDVSDHDALNSGIIEFRVRRVCLDAERSTEDVPVIAVEGRLYNPNVEEALDVLPAHRLFQLQGNGITIGADQRFEAENLSTFARPLSPLSGRDFAVLFALSQPSRSWVLVHPAQSGELRYPVALDGALVTGASLPGVMRPSPPAGSEPETEVVGEPAETATGTPDVADIETETSDTEPQTECYVRGEDCISLTVTAFANEIPYWFEKSEFTSAPADLLGPPDADRGMTLSCGGDVVSAFHETLLIDGPGVDLQIFSDQPLGPEVRVFVARTSDQWYEATATDVSGGFDVSGLPEADVGFDLVRLAHEGSGCTDTATGPKIHAVAAVAGRPSIRIDRRPEFSDLTGFAISKSIYGGKIVRLDQPPTEDVDPIFLDWTVDKLNDGDTYFSFRTHAESIEKPSSFAITFANGNAARVAALRTHTEVSGGFTYHPEKVAIYASLNGVSGPWERIGLTLTTDDRVGAEEYRFATPVTANALRIDFTPFEKSISYREEYNQSISEIEVIEVAEDDTYASVLRDVELNVLDPELGGHLVSFTSQLNEGEQSASSVLSNPVETFWQAETDKLPQEMIFAFQGHDLQVLDRITASMVAQAAFPEDWAPLIRVEISSDVSPLIGFQSLGFMVPDSATGRLVLEPVEPIKARYLKLVIVDPGVSPFGIQLVTARGQLARALGASSVFQRSLESETLQSDTEIEPDNNEVSSATLLTPGLSITGRPNAKGDVDNYRIELAGPDVSAVTLRLRGRPRVKMNVALFDETGQLIASSGATGTATDQSYTWLLDPGVYTVSLQQDAATLAVFIDNSGSLGPAIYDALDAAEGFISDKAPDERISLYSFNHAAVRLVERTKDTAQLRNAIETWRNSPEAGKGNGTTVYDSIMDGVADLSDVLGNKAVVLFTDGADATSKLTSSLFWDGIGAIDTPIFIVGYGEDMNAFSTEAGSIAGDVMRSIGLATEGGFYPAPTAPELPGVFAQIAERVRERSGYEISYDVSPGLGELEVLEVGGKMVSTGVLGNAIIIFDASGSMKARTDAGRQRINVARSVLFDLLEQVPEEVPMGVWLYGHSLPAKPKASSCRDVELLVPPAAANRNEIKDVAKAIAPKGQTPIGYALSRVGEEFSGGQSGLVILLTDGEETCDAEPDARFNPDRVVQGLIDQGIDLHVNIVGFDVNDPKIQAELARVAERTGGNFFYGEGQDGLREAMTSAFTAPVDVLDDTGRVVASGLVGDGPISLPQGRYRIRVSGTDFISERQLVRGGRATRLFLSQEASAVRMHVSDALIGAPYATDTDADDAIPEGVPPEFNADARVPETLEELIFKTQDLLTKLAYDPGPLDGAMGGKTRRAAQAFLEASGAQPGGEPFDARGNPTLFLWFELFAALSAK